MFEQQEISCTLTVILHTLLKLETKTINCGVTLLHIKQYKCGKTT